MERTEAFELFRAGQRLSSDDARTAEKRLESAPHLVHDRITLIGFYWKESCSGERFAENWCRHVLILVRLDPSAEFLRRPWFASPASCSREILASIRDEWARQLELHPASVPILENAAAFFARFDPPAADRLFKLGCTIDGHAGHWAHRRALLLSSQIKNGLADLDLISGKIRELELTHFEQTDDKGRSYVLGELAECAFAVGMDRDVVRLAQLSVNEAQRSHGSDGFDDPLHGSNILLGRAAIRAGNTTRAAKYLLDAAKICRPPFFEPVGPDVVLARELLKAGFKDAVAEYFTLCAELWVEGRSIVVRWVDEIRHGETPELSAETGRVFATNES
jgi:hypothetical protein